jgi:anti-sigma B factor antagonist
MEMLLRANGPDGFDTVSLKGDCDLYSAPALRKAIVHRIEGGTRKLRLDFSGVQYLDSTGVGSIIQIMKAIKTVNGTITFRGLDGAPKRVLEMSNVIALMKIESSVSPR